MKFQNLPLDSAKHKKIIDRRYNDINHFEKMLVHDGTIILKFFLHISKDEQKERLNARLSDSKKHWKFSPGDLVERKFWNDYQRAFDIMLDKTHTKHAPWTIVPADRKWYRDYVVSKTIVEELESIKMKFPALAKKSESP